jgi:uncharacterized protein with FMN-binding domain
MVTTSHPAGSGGARRTRSAGQGGFDEEARRATVRNTVIVGATALTVGVLFLFPTSLNRGAAVQRPGQVAPAGVVAGPVATPSAGATSSGTSTATTTVNGSPADTPYGPVQVQIQVSGGKIVSATAIDFPQQGGRDREINSFAIPLLQQETVAKQSAQIDSVSGATFTSNGYIQSLQSAIDAAHLH